MNDPLTDARPLWVTVAVLVILSGLSFLFRDQLYRAIAGSAEESLSVVPEIVEVTASKGLLVLVAITAVMVIVAWRGEREHFRMIVSAGIGTIAAYASSEMIKLLVAQERPCYAVGIDTVLVCPEFGDWSWPSNHATLAAAFATACVMVLPRLWPLVAPIAFLIALSRVAAGVHYVHDILAGITLGIVITTTVGLLLNAWLRRTFMPALGAR